MVACVLNFCIGYYASWLQIGNQNLGKLTVGVYPCGYHHHLISNTVSVESQELPRNISTPKLLRVSIHFLKLKSKAHRTTSAVQFVFLVVRDQRYEPTLLRTSVHVSF